MKLLKAHNIQDLINLHKWSTRQLIRLKYSTQNILCFFFCFFLTNKRKHPPYYVTLTSAAVDSIYPVIAPRKPKCSNAEPNLAGSKASPNQNELNGIGWS